MPDLPSCPEPAHAGSRVVKNGFYGRATKRQRYKCTPRDGSPSHKFVPLLPRLPTRGGRCIECENAFHEHEGPQLAKGFEYPVRTVAEALVRVSQGTAYTRATEAVRASQSQSGELVADWVAAFAGPLWDALGPGQVPRHLVVDSSRVTVANWRSVSPTWPPPKFTAVPRVTAYTLVALVGSDGGPSRGVWQWKPYLLAAVPATMKTREWAGFLGALPGRPLDVTVDADANLMGGIRAAWPDDRITGEAAARVNYCLYHLQRRFVAEAAPSWVRTPTTTEQEHASRALLDAVRVMNRSPEDWLAFVGKARALGSVKVNKWLARDNRIRHVAEQLARGNGAAQSNAAAEAELRWLRGQWAGRASCYRNATRTNNLLRLMTLHRRGADDPRVWSQVIREALARSHGHTQRPVRSICDPAGAKPSLRA